MCTGRGMRVHGAAARGATMHATPGRRARGGNVGGVLCSMVLEVAQKLPRVAGAGGLRSGAPVLPRGARGAVRRRAGRLSRE